jgi:hypothetical protein
MEPDGGRAATRWSVAASLLALATSLVMLLAPLHSQGEAAAGGNATTGAPPNSRIETKVTHPSLVETEGWSVAVPLSVPVVLTGVGVLAARRGSRGPLVLLAVLFGAGVVLSAASVGVFYLPAEVALIIASIKAG